MTCNSTSSRTSSDTPSRPHCATNWPSCSSAVMSLLLRQWRGPQHLAAAILHGDHRGDDGAFALVRHADPQAEDVADLECVLALAGDQGMLLECQSDRVALN